MPRPIVPLSSLIRGVSGKASNPSPTKIIKVSTKAIGINAQKTDRGETSGFDPAISIQHDNWPNGVRYEYAHEVEILGPCRILQNDLRPEISGARVWIETEAEIRCTLNER